MIRVGIMGLGQIAHRVAKGIRYAENAELYAVGSRSQKKAEAFQSLYGASAVYAGYEELLQDTKVDMIYICTPNHLHFEHIKMALAHGKHVLCEKPLVSNTQQLQECFALARSQNRFLMEAEKTLFTPLNTKLKQMVKEGAIGKLQYVEGSYSYPFDFTEVKEDHWCLSKEDGGSVYDVGVYPICYANWFADGNITGIQAVKDCALQGYDLFTQALITYDNGVIASVRSGWKQWMDNRGVLYGSEGSIETENFWKNTRAILKKDGICTPVETEMKSDFSGEVEHAAACIQQGLLESPILGERQSLEIMRVLEYVKSLQPSGR